LLKVSQRYTFKSTALIDNKEMLENVQLRYMLWTHEVLRISKCQWSR